MAAGANRLSVYTTGSGGSDGRNGEKKDLWSSMLDSVASGRRLPQKNLLVLGGSPESQREFLESLGNSDQKRFIDRQKVPPVANNFALGYTYYDVLDADQEDILARISLYMLSTPSPSFVSLIKPLLTPETIPNTLIVILLDWATPHLFLRQLQEWILMLREILRSLDSTCLNAMEDVMESWRDRGRAGSTVDLDGTNTATTGDHDAALPLGTSEWDDALGLPLCVVCQKADKMEYLEKTQGWNESDFDQILQYLRTLLLRHGASLIYTTPHIPSQLQSLVHACLSVTSLLKKQPLKHNTIDRDKILVPPNWDSWGKILVLREGFEVEEVSKGWAEDIQKSWPPSPAAPLIRTQENGGGEGAGAGTLSAVDRYDDWVPDATTGSLSLGGGPGGSANRNGDVLEMETEETQPFLSMQARALEAKKARDAAEEKEKAGKATAATAAGGAGKRGFEDDALESDVTDHIGPVQFNMGGIQVDADDMVRKIKDRNDYENSDPITPTETAPPADTAHLEAFFTSLIKPDSVSSSPQK